MKTVEMTQTVEPTVDVDRLAEDLAQLERIVPGTVDRLKRLAARERLEETTAPEEFDKIRLDRETAPDAWNQLCDKLANEVLAGYSCEELQELIAELRGRNDREAGEEKLRSIIGPIVDKALEREAGGDTLIEQITAVLEERGAAFQAGFLLELQHGEALIGKPESTGKQEDDDRFYFEIELVKVFENLSDEAKAAVWAYSELMGVGGYTNCKITDQIDGVIDAGINVNDAAQRTSWVKGIAGIVSVLNQS